MTGTSHAASTKAIFAGGCFWCMQPVFDTTPGVSATTVGYTGGTLASPTYEQVAEGNTGHVEAIEITYDANRVSYEQLVGIFLRNIDPFDPYGQFADKGKPYHTAIFTANAEEKKIAEQALAQLERTFPGKKVATTIRTATTFYAAEAYHQEYYEKNALRYNLYKHGSGRVTGLKEIWGEK